MSYWDFTTGLGVWSWTAPQPMLSEARKGDTIRGTRENDRLKGGRDDDRLVGKGGDDWLKGAGGKDTVIGGGGDDTLIGGGGADFLKGGGGADFLKGGGGGDELRGGGGDDGLSGGGGADSLSGGKGSNLLTGGRGPDLFIFGRADLRGAEDVITDFRSGQDRIDLSRLGVDAFSDLTLTADGDDTVIEIGGGVLRLRGVAPGELSAADFGLASAPSSSPTGNDLRKGGAGDDVIPTGDGLDTLTGQGGGDVFDIRLVAGALDDEVDVVTDFSFVSGDRIGVGTALAGVDFSLLSEVVRVTQTGGDTVIALNIGAGFQDALRLLDVSLSFSDLAAYGFEAEPRVSAGFAENPYGFANNNAAVADPDVTRDGQFLAFVDQTNFDGALDDFDVLTGDDEGDADLDVFVLNTGTGGVIRASADAEGNTLKTRSGDGADSHSPALSADGRWVVFATDGVGSSRDLNDEGDVYIRDLFNNADPVLISVAAIGFAGGGVNRPFAFAADSLSVADISADGNRVAFISTADLTGAGQTDTNGLPDVYLRDVAAGTTTLLSLNPGITFAGGVSLPYNDRGFGDHVKISEDGRYVAFLTFTPFSAATDGGSFLDVYLKDTQTGGLLHVSSAAGGQGVFSFDMSADGSRIAFGTEAAVDPDDTNGLQDIYVAEIDLNAFAVTDTFRVSERPGGEEIRDDESFGPVISPDGGRVAWYTSAQDVRPFEFTPSDDLTDRLFITDIATGTISQPVGEPSPHSFLDSEYGVFSDDAFFYRKTVPALPTSVRDVSETFANDGLEVVPLIGPDLPNSGVTGGQRVGVTDVVRSAIDSASDVDVFELRVFQNTFANIQVKGVDGGGGTLADPFLEVYLGAFDGTPEFTDNNGGAGRSAEIDGLGAGDYFIAVSSADGGTGTYGLELFLT